MHTRARAAARSTTAKLPASTVAQSKPPPALSTARGGSAGDDHELRWSVSARRTRNRCGSRARRCRGKPSKASSASCSNATFALSTVNAPPSTLNRARARARTRSPNGSAAVDLMAPPSPVVFRPGAHAAPREQSRSPTTRPASSSMRTSQPRMPFGSCPMSTVVHLPRSARSSAITSASASGSSALVASSITSSDGRRYNARAMPMRWRWPPLSCRPFCPTIAARPFGNPSTKSSSRASRTAARTRSRSMPSGKAPNAMFSATVASSSTMCCGT